MEQNLGRQAAAQSMMQAGIGSLSGNTINQPPLSTPRENYIFRVSGGHPDQLHDNKINKIISESQAKQDRWEELGGPNYDIITPGRTLNMPQYPVLNRNRISPGWLEAGITNPNLRGAKVMNAVSGPFKGGYPLPGMDWLEKKLFGDPYAKDPPPVGEDGELLPGWELHQDGWNYFPPNEGEEMPNEGEERYEDYINRGLEEMPYTLEADLNLQDVMDLYKSQGLDLNTDRFIRRANKAGVEVAGMDDSWQYLQQQINELDPNNPDHEDLIELLQSDIEMKYPWAIS